MNCLHCGDCCLRMSPISAPDPCPNLVIVENFYFCGIYENRPEECRNHKFPFRHCPVGVDILGLDDPIKIAQRIDKGYDLLKKEFVIKIQDIKKEVKRG